MQPRIENMEVVSGRVEQLMRITILDKNLKSQLNGPRHSGSMQNGLWLQDFALRPAGLPAAVLFDNTLAHEARLADLTNTAVVTTELQLHFLRGLPEDASELLAWTAPLINHANGGSSNRHSERYSRQ